MGREGNRQGQRTVWVKYAKWDNKPIYIVSADAIGHVNSARGPIVLRLN